LAYTYMHNIFGHEVIDIFDLKYIGDDEKKAINDETLPQEDKRKKEK